MTKVLCDAPSSDASESASPAADVALPAPRLQLRWEAWGKRSPASGVHYEWACHYELVLPLGEYDIRREVYNDEGEEVGERSELVVPIKGPTLRGGGEAPCTYQADDAPFRDGAHAAWDAKVLGDLPVYVIALDGSAALCKSEPEQ